MTAPSILASFGSSFGVADRGATFREAARILRPGGALFLVFNHRDLEDPLQAEIEAFIHREVPAYRYGPRREDQGAVIDGSGLFRVVRRIEERVAYPADASWVRAWGSHATLQRQAGERFDAIRPRHRRDRGAPRRGDGSVPDARLGRAQDRFGFLGARAAVSGEPSPAAIARSPLARVVRPRCAQLFVIFAARRDPDDTFVEAGDFLQLSGLAGRNLILVRDPYEVNYERGVAPHLGSSAALAAWIREKRAEMTHVRDVHCLGHSSGGYGALLFGHLIGADSVFAFSPRPASPRGAGWAKQSLVDLLAASNGVTRYRICFSVEHEADRLFAERFASCPGVTLDRRTEFGADHNVLPNLLWNGQLKAMVPPFAAVDA